MTTIAQAVADLLAAPRPILIVDTCALLDIVRAPLRDLTAAVRAAVELKTLLMNGTVELFVQDIVQREWTDNLLSARRDGRPGFGHSPRRGKSRPTLVSRPHRFLFFPPVL
jgi:hypothetical protein